jgi:hypothetical protein
MAWIRQHKSRVHRLVSAVLPCLSIAAILTFTCCTFSLVPKLTLVSYSSSMIIQPTIVRSYIHSQISISSMIISPTFGWKKVSGRSCLIMSSGITKLTTKTHTSSTCHFGIDLIY